jgi:hypothetical protein
VHPKRFLLVEGDEGVKEDDGGVCRGISEGLRWREWGGGESSVFLDGGVGEGERGLDVKGVDGHDGGWEEGGEGKREQMAL